MGGHDALAEDSVLHAGGEIVVVRGEGGEGGHGAGAA